MRRSGRGFNTVLPGPPRPLRPLQGIQELSGRAEIRQLTTLAEASVDGRQRLSRFGDAAAILEQSCQAHRGAQLPPSRALAVGDLEGATEVPLGIVGRLIPALAVATVPAAQTSPRRRCSSACHQPSSVSVAMRDTSSSSISASSSRA